MAPGEKAAFKDRAKSRGMEMSTYARYLLLGNAPDKHLLTPVEMEVTKLLQGIANNYNQIAKALNAIRRDGKRIGYLSIKEIEAMREISSVANYITRKIYADSLH